MKDFKLFIKLSLEKIHEYVMLLNKDEIQQIRSFIQTFHKEKGLWIHPDPFKNLISKDFEMFSPNNISKIQFNSKIFLSNFEFFNAI